MQESEKSTGNKMLAIAVMLSRPFRIHAGAPADHDDSLPEEFRFAMDGRRGGCGTHDSSGQQSTIAIRGAWVGVSIDKNGNGRD